MKLKQYTIEIYPQKLSGSFIKSQTKEVVRVIKGKFHSENSFSDFLPKSVMHFHICGFEVKRIEQR